MVADSKLLIVETLPSNRPAPLPAGMEIIMATILGKERTVEGFRDIVGRAGLEVTKVTRNPGVGALVECAKALLPILAALCIAQMRLAEHD